MRNSASPCFTKLSLVIALGVLHAVAHGQESSDPSSDAKMHYMREMLKRVEILPDDAESELRPHFQESPILRFGDATRQTADGALWVLGDNRPQVIVAMEFTKGYQDQTQLNYEFLCLTDQKFEVSAGEGWRWQPPGSEMKWQRLDSARAPLRSPNLQLRQMKQLAMRFSATENLEGEEFHLRLMPNPIYRYFIDDEKTWSGAIFTFANGTNPEVLLFLEASEAGWQYGFARMCGAAPTARFDEMVVWSKRSVEEIGKSWQLPYTGGAHLVELSPPATDQ